MFERTNTGVKRTFIRAIMIGMNCYIGSVIVSYFNSGFNFFLSGCVNLQRVIQTGDTAARHNFGEVRTIAEIPAR